MQVDRVHKLHEVLERQDIADRPEDAGVVGGRAETSGEECHRQQHGVHSCGRSFGRAKERGKAEAHSRESRGAEQQRKRERERAVGERCALQHLAEDEQGDRLQSEHDEDRHEHGREIDGRRDRRRSNPLQEPHLAPRDEE